MVVTRTRHACSRRGERSSSCSSPAIRRTACRASAPATASSPSWPATSACAAPLRGRRQGSSRSTSVHPALWRDPNKCVLCGRCVTVCHSVQGVGAIDFTARGYRTRVAPGFSDGLNVSDCVYCGQCARVCPTGAITERSQIDDVVAALADPDAVVVAQVAPAVPATLADEGSDETVTSTLERLAAALKRVGFDAVFDTSLPPTSR